MRAHRDDFGVEPIVRQLDIAPSTFYGWLDQDRDPCSRRCDDGELLEQVREVHDRCGQTYGAARVHATLPVVAGGSHASVSSDSCAPPGCRAPTRASGGGQRRPGRTHGRHRPRTWSNATSTAPAPDRLWVADATRIPCGEGAFWLAAVRDVFSNRIVGWKTSDRCDTELVLGALEYGVWSRSVRDGQLRHHADRGSNYTSFRFSARLEDHGILASLGSVGDSYDNALMENFFSTLKTELVYRRTWRTREQAENELFAYVDGWYNRERIQARLGWQSPDEHEHSWHTSRAHPEPAAAR